MVPVKSQWQIWPGHTEPFSCGQKTGNFRQPLWWATGGSATTFIKTSPWSCAVILMPDLDPLFTKPLQNVLMTSRKCIKQGSIQEPHLLPGFRSGVSITSLFLTIFSKSCTGAHGLWKPYGIWPSAAVCWDFSQMIFTQPGVVCIVRQKIIQESLYCSLGPYRISFF